ncbi:MAG: rhodanese-like domain-containing protein [Saprospiraceae bacterium]|nr:rhodanese-like domain-containing protein [Saprospiraceae bacterium]
MFSFLKKLFGGKRQQDILDLLQQKAIILDVRTVGEFRQGHVKGSVNIPLDQLRSQLSKLKKQKRPIVACCATGRRSGIAAGWIRQLDLNSVNGGSWQNVGRLLQKMNT